MIIDEVIKKYPDMPKPDAVFNIQNVADYMEDIYAITITEKDEILCKELMGKYVEESHAYRIDDILSIKIPLKTPFTNTWFEFKRSTKLKPEAGILAYEVDDFLNLEVFIKYSGLSVTYMGQWNILKNEYDLCKSWSASPPKDGPFHGYNKDQAIVVCVPVGLRAILALHFLHCKNVSTQENHIDKKLIKANIKRGKPRPYFEKFYTLEIEPMKKILNTEGQAQTIGLKKAFHICRGHFKTYDTNPLFGKVKGTFWVPAHTKGNIKSGVIKKDYKLKY